MLSDKKDFDLLINTVKEIVQADKNPIILDLLSGSQISIVQTDYDNWNGGIYGYTIYFVVDVKTFVAIRESVTELEKKLEDYFSMGIRDSDNENISRVTMVPRSKTSKMEPPNPHRALTDAENKKRDDLLAYLKKCSEDDLINDILLPLFRQMGFHRITAAGHKDKSLEYGKDIWMKYTLPTQHVLYFGIQAKKDKLDAAGTSKSSTANVAEIHQQVLMMLGHEIFDPELSRKVLVDHAFIVAGGEITKAARNWIGGKLDATKRSQIMFMDRDDIVNLYVVTNLPLPNSALTTKGSQYDDDLPF